MSPAEPPPYDLVVSGRALVARDDGPPAFATVEIGVRGGRIAAIAAAGAHQPGADHPGADLTAAHRIQLAPDEVLLPGLVDTHVHVNEPGRTEWEGFASATRAAAAGGVTTIIDMPLNSIPPTVTPEALEVKRTAARPQAAVDVGFWGGAVPGNLGSLRALHDAGVFGFKAFLAPSGVDEFGHLDAAQLDAALDELAGFDGLLLVHAEDPGVLDAASHEGGPGGASYRAYVASRPDEAEVVAISRVIAGVRRTGTRAHILHLSSAAALPELRAARASGLPITVETCPHYLTLASETIPDGGTQFKCAPPIRSRANRDALWQALRDGDIDIVVSDHSPATAEVKSAGDGDFARAWGGIAGLQLGLAAVWTAAAEREVPLDEVVRWMSTAPAALAGLPQKGLIAVGRDADFVVFAPDERFTVRAHELLHKNPVTAYDGAELRGVVRRTFQRGAPPGQGALLTR